MRSKIMMKLKSAKGFLLGAGTVAILFLFIRGKSSDGYFEISKNLDIYTTLLKELNTYYVDPIEPGKLIKTGIDAMLQDLDPYTNFITEADIEEYEFQTTGKYGGIGTSMRRKNDGIYIGEVYENSPAQKAGLRPGDQVLSIDQENMKGKSIDDISVLLKGAPGTIVTLKIKDVYTGNVSERKITRGEIEISSVPYAGLVGPEKKVAFVRLTQFTQQCGRQIRTALDSLKKVQPDIKGVVLDLRNNPGGLLDEAVNICNIFVDKGHSVVSTKGKVTEWDYDYKTTAPAWDTTVPVAVLINHLSASASEIVSGTMQDLDRGVIIGERSYGKGLVQKIRPLGYNAKLKVTTAKYYIPSGRCIQAIDYTNRNPDGSVGHVPDSLKKEFRTSKGRKVWSGGGVEPDVRVSSETISKLSTTMYSRNYFFDYATEYVHDHPKPNSPSEFALTANEYAQFVKWLDNKDCSYKTEAEDLLDSVRRVVTREKYYDDVKNEFTALQTKMTRDKKQDLAKHQDEVIRMLESEIISRYFFTKGRIEQSLRHDEGLSKALEMIANKSAYQALLTPKK
jgi:carboxyl-terminal processing protease